MPAAARGHTMTRTDGDLDDWCVIGDDDGIARGWGKSLFASASARGAGAGAREATTTMRIDRVLLKAGRCATRGEAKRAIEDGRVTLDDGAVVTKGDARVDRRRVVLDGETVVCARDA